MKKLMLFTILCMFVFSCTPTLRKDLLDTGVRDVQLSEMTRSPDAFKGKLFILGGAIINVKATEAGTFLELMYIPVDQYGHLKEGEKTKDRYLALYRKEMGTLDPQKYERGREVTLAGTFVGARAVKVKETTYAYPLFKIEQVHLWEEKPILEKGDLPAIYPWEFPHPHPETDDGSWRYYAPLP